MYANYAFLDIVISAHKLYDATSKIDVLTVLCGINYMRMIFEIEYVLHQVPGVGSI